VSAAVAAIAAVLLVFDGAAAAVGIVALSTAGAVTTAVRAPPFAPPTAREVASALFVALATAFAVVAGTGNNGGIVLALQVGLACLGILAVSRPLLVAGDRLLHVRPLDSSTAGEERGEPIATGALAHVAPMLDDAFLHRAGSPRVNARVTAKRLLESALDGARANGADNPVEVREDGADVDVEGDPGQLAEALSAVLDNALGLQQSYPELYVRVHVRGSPGHVTFEVSDDLSDQEGKAAGVGPVADRPFASARAADERPGLGVGLARARLIAERHGGSLLVRQTKEGSCVQLTLPRRRSRTRVGLA
jgi:signal transduction histidine kinase